MKCIFCRHTFENLLKLAGDRKDIFSLLTVVGLSEESVWRCDLAVVQRQVSPNHQGDDQHCEIVTKCKLIQR